MALPDSRFSASQVVARCSHGELMQLARPADEEVRRLWMRRFTTEMHWLPLIEVLSGCRPDTAPEAHQAFADELAARAVPRVAHRPWGTRERLAWACQLSDRVRKHCLDIPARKGINAARLTLRDGDGDVLFADNACIAAAEAVRPACLSEPPWLFYKAIAVVGSRLPNDEHRVLVMMGIADDPSSKEYCRLLANGTL